MRHSNPSLSQDLGPCGKKYSMTDKQLLNCRVAKCLGWVGLRRHIGWDSPATGIDPVDGQEAIIPEYASDLNKIHAACQQMIKKHGSVWMVTYARALWDILGNHDHVEYEAVHATALQRAEAFLIATLEPRSQDI